MSWGSISYCCWLACRYAGAINKGVCPTIYSAWESVVMLQGKDAVQAATNAYRDHLYKGVVHAEEPQSTAAVHQAQAAAEALGLAMLHAKAVGDAGQLRELEARFRAEAESIAKEVGQSNRRRSEKECRSVLDRLCAKARLDQRLAEGAFASAEELQAVLRQLVAAYHAEAKGAAKQDAASGFVEEKMSAALAGSFARQGLMAQEMSTLKKEAKAREGSILMDKDKWDDLQASLDHARGQLQAVQQESEQSVLKKNELEIEVAELASICEEWQEEANVWKLKASENEENMRAQV